MATSRLSTPTEARRSARREGWTRPRVVTLFLALALMALPFADFGLDDLEFGTAELAQVVRQVLHRCHEYRSLTPHDLRGLLWQLLRQQQLVSPAGMHDNNGAGPTFVCQS